MKTVIKLLFFFFSLLLIFTFKTNFDLFKLTPTTIISRHNWPKFVDYQDKKILAGQKIAAEFKATNNRLGEIGIRLDVYRETINDTLIFRLKEKDSPDWYYQNKYNNIDITHSFFPFGFTIIEDSKNKTYEIEIESVGGTNDQAYALNPNNPFFLSRYSFPFNYLKQNKPVVIPFVFGKIYSNFISLVSVPMFSYFLLVFFSFLIPSLKSKTQTITVKHLLLINFFNLICLLIIGITLAFSFSKNSESLEWTVYEVSALGSVSASFIFNWFLKKKISLRIYNKLLKVYLIVFSAFILLVSLTKGVSWRHFIFMPLALIFPLEIVLINFLGIISVLAYFAVNFLNLSLLQLVLIYLITLVIFLNSHSLTQFIQKIFNFPRRVLILILFALIFYLIQKPVDYHHYSYYLGPAFDVLKGKSLLSDTPSQYGYLSIHFLAMILGWLGASLASFHLVNTFLFVLFYFLTVLICFRLIKNKYLAFFVSVIFITLQLVFNRYNQSLFPSIGPMRFSFGLLIIGILSYFPQSISFILGSILAGVSLFWSAETAIYVIPAWLSVCLVINYKTLIRRLTFFGLVIMVTFSLIVLKECSMMHSFPRILNYFDYALAYKAGFAAVPIPVFGNYYLLIIIMLLGIVTITYLLTKKIKTDLLPLLIFITVLNLATFSYFISRSYDNNVVVISGFFIFQLIIILKILKQLKKIIVLPLILFSVLYIFIVFTQFFHLRENPRVSLQNNFHLWFNPPTSTPVLANALKDYQLDNQPVVLLSQQNDTQLLIESNLKNELPFNPGSMTVILNNWQDKYLNPILPTLKIGTVVIIAVDQPYNILEPAIIDLQKHYRLKEIGVINSEKLVIYQIVSKKI